MQVSLVQRDLATEAHISRAIATSGDRCFELALRLTVTNKLFRRFVEERECPVYVFRVFGPAFDALSLSFLSSVDTYFGFPGGFNPTSSLVSMTRRLTSTIGLSQGNLC